jgi:hypothetical protein
MNFINNLNKDLINIGNQIVRPVENITNSIRYGNVIYLIDIQLLLIFSYCKQNVKCKSTYIERIIAINNDNQIIGGRIFGKLNKILGHFKKKPTTLSSNIKPIISPIKTPISPIISPIKTPISPIISPIKTPISPIIPSSPIKTFQKKSLKTAANAQPYIYLKNFRIEIDNFLNILINMHIVIFELKDNLYLSLAGLNKANILNKLKQIKSIDIDNINRKINIFSVFLVTLKKDCLSNTVCKRYIPGFLKNDKIQLKIDLLLSNKTLSTDVQSILQIKILVEIVGIYLNENKLKNLENLNKAYLQLKLKLDEEKQAISQTTINGNNITFNSINTPLLHDNINRSRTFNSINTPLLHDNMNRSKTFNSINTPLLHDNINRSRTFNSINTPLLHDNMNRSRTFNNSIRPVNDSIRFSRSKKSESNIFKTNVAIHTLLITLKTIKQTADSKIEQIKNNLVNMKDRQLINIKIKKILNEINSIHDWMCVICILLHNIPRIESKIKNGLLSETLGIPTFQKAIKPVYNGIQSIIKKDYTLHNNLKKKDTGNVINNELLYILIIVLFNHKKF